MLDHFRAKGTKFWWVVTSGLTDVLDHKNLTKAQKVLFELDFDAYLFLMDALSFEVNHKGTAHELWESIKHTFGDFSMWDDGKFKKEEPKEEVHECVEHDHDSVIMEDCSTSWSSDGDDDTTTSSLDKIDDDATSDANDDATPCTLDGDDDGSCLGCQSDVSSSSPTTSHCFMSQGDTKVYNANVIDLDSYEELLDRYGCTIKTLEKEIARTKKLKNKNFFSKEHM
jgi:hypothetical protein